MPPFADIQSKRDHISRRYSDPEFVRTYVFDRFSVPFGRIMHENQVDFIKESLEQAKTGPILEIAPGPFRIGDDLGDEIRGVQLDSSREMIGRGKEKSRLKGYQENWEFVLGSAKAIPFEASIFSGVLAFRFLWHFERVERINLMKEARRVLGDEGMLVFDFPNPHLGSDSGVNASNDVEIPRFVLSLADIETEVLEAGFCVKSAKANMRMARLANLVSGLHRIRLESVSRIAIGLVNKAELGRAVEWLVCCEKK